MNKKVMVMVGAPASGKSTYAKEFASKNPNTKIISSDEYRIKMFGSLKEGNSKENNGKVFSKMFEDLRKELKDSDTEYIIYDATNTSRKRRRALYRNIKAWNPDAKVEITYFSFAYVTLMFRNIKRAVNHTDVEKHVPFGVMRRMYAQLQVPRVGSDCDSFTVVGEPMFDSESFLEQTCNGGTDMLRKLVDSASIDMEPEIRSVYAPHDCEPHHLESIDEHIAMCIDSSLERYEYSKDDKSLILISLFHDLGKSFTKEMIEKNGVEKAIYRGHADVSANYLLNFVWFDSQMDIEKYMDATEAVHQHMNQHQGISEKNIRNNNLNANILAICKNFGVIDSNARIKGEIE